MTTPVSTKKWKYVFVSDDLCLGFGGKHGLQTDRQDKSAVGYDEKERDAQPRKETPVVTSKGTASSLRARFEKLATSGVGIFLSSDFVDRFLQLLFSESCPFELRKMVGFTVRRSFLWSKIITCA